MGSEISKKYDMEEEPTASAGAGLLWQLYAAVCKTSLRPVSVWVMKKEDLKGLDREKGIKEKVLAILREERKILQTMRHPCVLTVIECFEESRTTPLTFVTERVEYSLANLLGDPGSLGRANNGVSSAAAVNMEPYEVARGAYSLAEALQYCHTIGRRLHLNVSPESIVITPTGQWKLAGFGFSIALPAAGGYAAPCPYFKSGPPGYYDGRWRLHPVLPFSSPESSAASGQNTVTPKSDSFSLGCIMYQMLQPDPRAPSSRLLGLRGGAETTPMAHQTCCSALPSTMNLHALPVEAQQVVASLLAQHPASRSDACQLTTMQLFHSQEVSTLRCIDSLSRKDPAEAAAFLTGVLPTVQSLPLRIQKSAVLKGMLSNAALDESGRLWSFVIPVAADVCSRLEKGEITRGGEASIQSMFKPGVVRKEPETLAASAKCVELFLDRFDRAFVCEFAAPMVCSALALEGHTKVQQAALEAVQLPRFCSTLPPKQLEDMVLPRVCWLVVKSSQLSNRVNALMCLSQTFQHYSVNATINKLIPTLKFAVEKNDAVAVQLCVLGCFEAIAKKLEVKAHVATAILPAVTPILACSGLNPKQFEIVATKVVGLMDMAVVGQREAVARGPAPPSATAATAAAATGGATASSGLKERAASPPSATVASRLTSFFGGKAAAAPAQTPPAPAQMQVQAAKQESNSGGMFQGLSVRQSSGVSAGTKSPPTSAPTKASSSGSYSSSALVPVPAPAPAPSIPSQSSVGTLGALGPRLSSSNATGAKGATSSMSGFSITGPPATSNSAAQLGSADPFASIKPTANASLPATGGMMGGYSQPSTASVPQSSYPQQQPTAMAPYTPVAAPTVEQQLEETQREIEKLQVQLTSQQAGQSMQGHGVGGAASGGMMGMQGYGMGMGNGMAAGNSNASSGGMRGMGMMMGPAGSGGGMSQGMGQSDPFAFLQPGNANSGPGQAGQGQQAQGSAGMGMGAFDFLNS